MSIIADNIIISLTAITAVGTFIAAIAAWKSTQATKRAAEGAFLNRFLEQFSTAGFLRALRLLRNWKHEKGEDFARIWYESLKREDREALKIDLARRKVSLYFHRALLLTDSGYADENFLKAVLSLGGVDILYEIVEPMAYEMDPDDDAEKVFFERLRRVRPPVSAVGRLKEPLPVPKH
jgi:hypothetical protein